MNRYASSNVVLFICELSIEHRLNKILEIRLIHSFMKTIDVLSSHENLKLNLKTKYSLLMCYRLANGHEFLL